MTRRLSIALLRFGASLVLRGARLSGAFDALDRALLREALSTALRMAIAGRPARVRRGDDGPRFTAPGPMGFQ